MKAVATVILAAALSVAAASTHAATRHGGGFKPGITHLTPGQRYDVKHAGEWHAGCPVRLSQLRVVTYRYWGFDHKFHLGQIVVNAKVAHPITKVFAKLRRMKFPIRDGKFLSAYGPHAWASGDVTASFECRDAVPSPCSGGSSTHTWSMHAYGEAVDLDPRENPYVGCGMTRDKTARSYRKRSNVRPGMVTKAIYRHTFGSIGWGWGGLWTGSTKDYMHFSINGH
jgi:D-alanyl-D-alanine carboxypeptidase-like protein